MVLVDIFDAGCGLHCCVNKANKIISIFLDLYDKIQTHLDDYEVSPDLLVVSPLSIILDVSLGVEHYSLTLLLVIVKAALVADATIHFQNSLSMLFTIFELPFIESLIGALSPLNYLTLLKFSFELPSRFHLHSITMGHSIIEISLVVFRNCNIKLPLSMRRKIFA